MQDLQDGLLDEPIQHGRNPELADSSPALRYLLLLDRLRLVASVEQRSSDSRPVGPQIRVAAPPRASRRCLRCPCSAPLSSTPAPRCRASVTSSIRCAVPERSFPFVADPGSPPRCAPPRASPACCVAAPFRGFGCFPSSRLTVVSLSFPFGPSQVLSPATTASADFSHRFSASPFQAQARSPRVRVMDFRTQPPGYTSVALGHESFAVICPLALASRRLVSDSCSSARASACHCLQHLPRGRHLVASREIPVTWFLEGLSPPFHAHAGRT